MSRYRIKPTQLDRQVALQLARHASSYLEDSARLLTIAADERILAVAAGIVWLASRSIDSRHRAQANYLALNVAIAAVLPHLLKHAFTQLRPDRRLVHGRRHGIPISGKAYDAFPSGHAVHVGAIASALSRYYPGQRALIWSVGAGLVATRVILLAHWVSDVVAGLALGSAVEALLWRIVRGGRKRRRQIDVDR